MVNFSLHNLAAQLIQLVRCIDKWVRFSHNITQTIGWYNLHSMGLDENVVVGFYQFDWSVCIILSKLFKCKKKDYCAPFHHHPKKKLTCIYEFILSHVKMRKHKNTQYAWPLKMRNIQFTFAYPFDKTA